MHVFLCQGLDSEEDEASGEEEEGEAEMSKKRAKVDVPDDEEKGKKMTNRWLIDILKELFVILKKTNL